MSFLFWKETSDFASVFAFFFVHPLVLSVKIAEFGKEPGWEEPHHFLPLSLATQMTLEGCIPLCVAILETLQGQMPLWRAA